MFQKRCIVCNKEYTKSKYNCKYCSDECKNRANTERVNLKKPSCEICGFGKIVEKHHIIKRVDFGSDKLNNIVYLCPNHHKMADSKKYKELMLNLIYSKTKKSGECLSKTEIKEIEDEIAKRVGVNSFEEIRTQSFWKQYLIRGLV